MASVLTVGGIAIANPATAASVTSASKAASSKPQSTDFQNLNGFMWFYNTYFDYKYTDITNNLDTLKKNGTRVLGFFSPYNGDKTLCDGCDPLDFFSVSPQNGTIEDWKNLVAQAHKRGMKVVSYFVNIYMDAKSPFFQKAEQQYAAGDRTSREVSSFVWTTDPSSPKPRLQMPPSPRWSTWQWSETAHAYYWKLWFGPGFDFDSPGSQAELTRIEKFWLDTGIDGFMWDVGSTDPAFQKFAVTLPTTYTSNDKWLTFEKANGSNAPTFAEFGLTSWFNYRDEDNWTNDYTNLVNGTIDVNGLEAELQNSDYARSVGATTYAWSIGGDDPEANFANHTYPTYANDDVMRVQEAALLAGSGVLYGSPMYDQYLTWSPTLRANWDRVLSTVNNNKALLPAASRDRVATLGSDTKVFAQRRTSEDGKQTALLVYNFNPTPTTVTVDLTGTGIDQKQNPKDLYNGGKGAKIDGSSYSVTLAGYGFTFLDVKTTK
ncbi:MULTISPECIES: alpha-amylase family glycosyl hydrolase [unclassified Microbacterium]|uniref:alpha-amylase family glycosyl hydrolase n=1 Tax=unclassified Microbacterium TaxID=2609290 RepID=UPI0036495477